MKVAVIGAGASGLVAAIYSALEGNEVTLIERNNICGKKILITGNGKCNYFNSDMNLKHYYSNNKDLLKSIINEKNNIEILNFFQKIGIEPKIKNGYYYPRSNKAISVRDALLKECELLKIKIINNFLVKKITKKEQFIIKSENNTIKCDSVILALGSKAYPKTGSDGMGYNIAKSFGHDVIKPLPALVQLIGKENYFKIWSGVRSEVKLTLFENNKKIKEEQGEIQFADYGISGICVFNLSTLISKGLEENKKEEIIINFIPWINANSEKDVIKFLEIRNKLVSKRTIFELLEGILDYKLIKVITKTSNINPDKYYNQLTSKQKNNLAYNLYHFSLPISATKSFENAQTCIGGVPLSQINVNSMESLKTKKLYIIGELLDVSGDCGGYNLAFAFISGMLAGKGQNNA